MSERAAPFYSQCGGMRICVRSVIATGNGVVGPAEGRSRCITSVLRKTGNHLRRKKKPAQTDGRARTRS